MQLKQSIINRGRMGRIGLAMALAALPNPLARGEGEVSAEEQRLRELFLRVREENRREAGVPQKPVEPAPEPQGVAAPKSVPAPAKPRARPPASVTARSEAVAKSTPVPSARAGSEASRFGHNSPPLPSPPPPPGPSEAKPAAQTAQRPVSAAAAPPSPASGGDVADGLGAKLRGLAGNLTDRLSSLPRTPQSHAAETAEAAPPGEPAGTPVRKTTPTPPSLSRKPADAGLARKSSPKVPAAPVPVLPDTPAKESPSAIAMASIGKAVPEIDTDTLIGGGKIDLTAAEPEMRPSLAETAESIRRSLLEEQSAPTPEAKEPAQPVHPVSVPAAPDSPVAATPPAPAITPPKARPNPVAGTQGGMAGAVFERLARHAMALGVTAVMAGKPQTALAPPRVEPLPAAAEPAPAEDVPDYVKAARKLAEPIENIATADEGHSTPGLNDFVISASHQTDFDIESSSITFAGHVVVESSRFHLTCDKFVVHMLPDQKGMDYGEALGNVVIHMMNQRQATGHTGHARSAIYRPEDGEIILTGWPRIVEETKELVGITEDAKMILTTAGSVRTVGRNRTILKR